MIRLLVWNNRADIVSKRSRIIFSTSLQLCRVFLFTLKQVKKTRKMLGWYSDFYAFKIVQFLQLLSYIHDISIKSENRLCDYLFFIFKIVYEQWKIIFTWRLIYFIFEQFKILYHPQYPTCWHVKIECWITFIIVFFFENN